LERAKPFKTAICPTQRRLTGEALEVIAARLFYLGQLPPAANCYRRLN
jgi:hypothetical protein